MKVTLLALVLGLALVAGGCGGEDDDDAAAAPTPIAAWAESYCSAIVDWATELEASTDELRNLESLSQETFEEAGNDIRSATDTFTAELRSLGAPDTVFGEEARTALETFATAAETDIAEIEQTVENVSAISGISKAVTSITVSLTSMNKAFMTMVDSLREIDPEEELQSALEDAESCDDLSSR